MGRTQLSRLIVDRVRKAEDFAGSAAVRERAPVRRTPDVLWSIEKIRAARDAQMRGDFAQPVRLAEAMRTDDALYTAYHNRIAPQSAVATKLVAVGGARGEAVCRKAQASCFVSRGTLVGLAGTLANHAIAIGYIVREPNDDGTRVDLRLTEWPLEFVRWNPTTEQLETQTKHGGAHVPIVHGDGYWVVFKKTDVLPWTQEAALLPASMIWGAHAYALADWAGASKSHGLAKIVGELPEGVSLQEKLSDGSIKLNAEADAFLRMIQDVVSGEAQAAVRPAGSKLDVLANTSTMYQIFSELITDRKKAAAFVYLGTDASLGAAGGAPGVDVSALFGISSTKLQGDFDALEQGLNTGFYPVWTAINCGDSRYSPRLEFQIPDPDAKAKSEESAAKRTRLANAIKEMKDTGMIVDQDTVNLLAKELGVSPAPLLASGDTKAVPIQLAPTDIAKIVRVGPALRSIGLEPFGDDRDGMTITELDEASKAKAAAAQAGAPVTAAATAVPWDEAVKLASLSPGRTFDESKISRADDGKFGSGPGAAKKSGDAPSTDDAKKASREKAQADFDGAAKRANDVAKASGHSETMNRFLNVDRASVSRAERNGEPSELSDATADYLKKAKAAGADYKGQVFRGTTPAELERIRSGGVNTTTWSVSKDPEGSASFAKKGGVLLTIKGNSGAIPVDGIDNSVTFNEALMPKGTRLKIASERTTKSGVMIVELTIDGDGDGRTGSAEKADDKKP